MQEPPLPYDEQHRLESLNDLNVLHTASEKRYDRLSNLCSKVLDVPNVAVNLVAKDEVWTKSHVGSVKTECPRDVSFCAHTMLEPGVSVIPDARRDDRFRDNPLVDGDSPRIFYMSHPLYASNGQPVGSLCVFDEDVRRPGSDRQETLAQFAESVERELQRGLEFSDAQSQLIDAMESFYLERLEKAQRRARTDPLTKLWNRRAIQEHLGEEINRANREESPLSVMMLDLDDFKSVNDRFGHSAGDAVLEEVAARMRWWTRDYDWAARYGGDEFLVVLPECDHSVARSVATRLYHNLRQTIPVNDDLSVTVTPSIGVAAKPSWHRSEAEELVNRSDRALYRAKSNGESHLEVSVPQSKNGAPARAEE